MSTAYHRRDRGDNESEMPAAPARLQELTAPPQPSIAWYSILGVPVAVASDVPDALLRLDASYAAFRAETAHGGEAVALRLEQLPHRSGYLVSGATRARRWPAYEDALLDLFDRLVHALLARLLAQGVYALHAGAVVDRGAALALA